MTSITVYDGAETIGGNKIYVEKGGEGIFLDFGMNFARHSAFFEEFLTERDSRGIHDQLCLGMIPKLNIYRRDLITSDIDEEVSSYVKPNVRAVLLSHAHFDHCGNIGLLDGSIPIVASHASVAILKALRDISQSGIESDIAYMSIKERNEDMGGLILKSEMGNYVGRDFYCTCNPPEKLKDFISGKPGQNGKRAKKLEPGRLGNYRELDLPFDIDHYNVDHSIYGSVAYIIRSDDSSIAYTGDFRLSGTDSDLSKFIKDAKNASALVVEGTRVGRERDVNVTEDMVYQKCLETVEDTCKLVIADFSSKNFERLNMFMRIARETGRQLVVTARDAYMLHAIECTGRACRLENLLVYNELKDRTRAKWETETVQGECKVTYINHRQISGNPGNYILCFSLFDMKHLLDIRPDGGSYIYSSCEAFTEEQEIDFLRLKNWLDLFKMNVYGFEMVKVDGQARPGFIKGYHASGHVSMDELAQVIDRISPEKIIPVHTTGHEWFKSNFENVVALKNGSRIIV